MEAKEKLLYVLASRLKAKGLDDDERYHKRLKAEMREVDLQDEHEYFWDLYEKNVRYSQNENNLLISYLLDIVSDFDIEKEAIYFHNDFPDVDVDFIPIVQDYLRNDWAPREFGRENVCNIGNYGTFGIKSAMIDMARIFGADRDEILAITTKLGLKDEEGKTLSFDSAVKLSPEFKNYCEKYPQVADGARRLIGRIRSRGKHAGGTIIANGPINNIVPLTLDTDGKPVSAWTEGLNEQDLQPVGYIKFDVLSIKDLLRIAECVRLVKERHGLKSISSLLDQSDWTDVSYLNDKEALSIANEGKTRGVFQFDGDGMRRLLKQGGVTCFEDLVAYNALFRPGPLNLKMHEAYIDRKQGRDLGWQYEVPDILKPILMKTYNVIIYQEQIMKILHVVGDISLIHCEKVRKAISKKDDSVFGKYKEMFVVNGQRNLGWSKEQVEHMWEQIEAFAEYGFNLSHSVAYTYISSRLLYLKAHYLLEFFTITLRMESKKERICSCKREAEKMGIEVCVPVLNKSGATFNIIDDKIYTGYSNIQGIGKETAQRLVEGQPYDGLEDFLKRFGTDAKVLKPLIQLGMFEGDRSYQWAFYEEFKEISKKRKNRQKGQHKAREKWIQQIKDLFVKDLSITHEFLTSVKGPEDVNFMEENYQPGADQNDVWSIVKRYQRSVNQFEEKEVVSDAAVLSLNVDLEEVDKLLTIQQAESAFYGFTWKSTVEQSPDYEEYNEWNFERLDNASKPGRKVQVVVVKPIIHRMSRKEKSYYQLFVEDADRRQEKVIFWEDDYDRFEEELEFWDVDEKRGHLLSLVLAKSTGGFNSYKFDAPPRHHREKRLPKDKKDDWRLMIMQPPVDEDIVLNQMRNL